MQHQREKVGVADKCEVTHEQKVDLIDVKTVDVVQIPRPQTIVETRVVERPIVETRVVERPVVETKVVERPVPVEVKVPVIEEKVVVHEVEKIVAEQPTHIHHIELETPDVPTSLPLQFHEEIDEGGLPWWLWLLPLLCCIPLLAWLLCRKPKPKPVVRPKQPMAPVAAKALTKPKEREIMEVKTVERHSPERKYVIERKVVDEGEAIEQEIERELKKSRAVRESHAARPVSHGRQTAAEIAGEGALARASGKGRTRRIKTIKKFGQVIGREEQILDEDGNIISTKKIGLDENEYASDQQIRSVAGGSEYQRESRYAEDIAAPTSSALAYERRSRRGYSSGRHVDNADYASGEGGNTAGFAYEVRSGAATGDGVTSGALGDGEYGRYSPGRNSRGSRVSLGGSGRHGQQYRYEEGGDLGDDRYYV